MLNYQRVRFDELGLQETVYRKAIVFFAAEMAGPANSGGQNLIRQGGMLEPTYQGFFMVLPIFPQFSFKHHHLGGKNGRIKCISGTQVISNSFDESQGIRTAKAFLRHSPDINSPCEVVDYPTGN